MKLLLDENLSCRLVPALQARCPGYTQVVLVGLERASDRALCDFAARHGFVGCSKDDDVQRLLAVRGYRPRLIHLALGNATNDRVLKSGRVTMPGEAGDDLAPGTLNSILKQAGLK